MNDLNNLDTRQDVLQQSPSYTLYLPIFSLGMTIFYVGVYILRYYCWRIKQRRRKIRLLEYEKLRWMWHQKRIHVHCQTKEAQNNNDMDNEEKLGEKNYPFLRSSSSSSSSVITINKNDNEIKMKTKQNQQHQSKYDYGDDSSHCRETNLVVTIPSPAYQPSHNYHCHLTQNQKSSTQLHHHQHQSSTSSSSSSSSTTTTTTSSSSIKKSSSPGHQRSYYSSSSSTITFNCPCKKENTHHQYHPCLTSSPTELSFSNPGSPSSSLKETPGLFYPNQEEKNEINYCSPQDNRLQSHAMASIYDKKDESKKLVIPPVPITTTSSPVVSKNFSSPTYWPIYDTKAKRTRMVWKWSVAMGYCHYDHAKMITSIIDQLNPPPSRDLC